MFEVCAHRWADLSERGAGLAILNDSKYGYSCHGGVLGLSLLRSTRHPDPEADMGAHEFTYSLMPHDGDWRNAGVDREAEALNTPPVAYRLNPGEPGPAGVAWAPFSISAQGGAGVAVAALKRREDGDGLVLRLWESHGGRGAATITWNIPVKQVAPADLLEAPLEHEGFAHGGATTKIPLRPFQIVTLSIRL
jgi:alpha-mannosidase